MKVKRDSEESEVLRTVYLSNYSLLNKQVNQGRISSDEMKEAIKRLKSGKSPGIDQISAELLKKGGDELEDQLLTIGNKVLCIKQVPNEWIDGIIIKLPKKGNLSDCSNWRGITLLSIPGKVVSMILLNLMKNLLTTS